MGFSFNSNPFTAVKKNASLLILKDSNFDFFLNANTPLGSICVSNSTLIVQPLLSNFENVLLGENVNTSLVQV